MRSGKSSGGNGRGIEATKPKTGTAACAALVAAALLLASGTAAVRATETDGSDRTVLSEELSGRDIYAKVLDNHLRTSLMEQRMISTDPGGDTQELRFWTRFRDYRVDGGPDPDGIVSKMMVRFTYPQDKRDAAYLFIEHHRDTNEGFNYSRMREKVNRINTSRETIFGTDFTLEDLAVVRVLDDATYKRLPDEVVQDGPVYVIEAVYDPEAEQQYSRSILYVDPKTFVPLRMRHWNLDGIENKFLEASRQRIERHDGVWVPMEATMKDTLEDTQSVLYTDSLQPNIELADQLFSPKRLAKNRR